MDKKEDHTSPIKGQFPDLNKIKCRDCIYRDKTVVELNGKEIKVGVTRAFCDMFIGPPDDNGKPRNVLFGNEDCDLYEKE